MALNDSMYDFYSLAGSKFNKAFTGFNELSVAAGNTVIDLKSIYGISTLRDDQTLSGSADITNDKKEYRLQTGATSGSNAKLSSAEYGRYIAGFEAIPGIAVRVPVLPTGDQVARWGYFDGTDGFGVGIDSTGLFTFVRRGGSDNITRIEDWNGEANRKDINLKQHNIFRFPFRWYGAGPIQFQISNILRNSRPGMETLHTEVGIDGSPIINNPNLPICAEVDNGTTTDNFEIYVTGRQFFINGEYSPVERLSSEYRIKQSVGSTNFVPLISWRQKSTFQSVSVKLGSINLLVSNNPVVYQVRLESTLSGGTDGFQKPSDLSASETALEFDNDSTALTGGEKVFEALAGSGTGGKESPSSQDLPDLNLPAGSNVTLCAKGVGGTATVTTVLSAKEEW